MRADVLGRRVATAITEEPGDRIPSTLREVAPEHISSHAAIQARSVARMEIRLATVADAEAVRAIYNHEVEHSTATFDLVPRTLAEQQAWIREREGALGVVVAEHEGRVVGFASLSPYRSKPAYNTTVEDSVYVDRDARGLGAGKALLEEIIAMASARGFHTIVAHISDPDGASVALHRSCGFTVVGIQKEVGRKFGKWLDVVLMQRMV